MATQGNRQSQNRRPAPNRGGKAAPKQQTQPVKRKKQEREETTPGAMLWKFALILCCGLIVFSLLFASINGGSQYVGLPENDTKTTPTPPVETIDPALNVTGSDLTPIPPSASPEGDTATGEDTGDVQTVTP